jgi:hypothetical protein
MATAEQQAGCSRVTNEAHIKILIHQSTTFALPEIRHFLSYCVSPL